MRERMILPPRLPWPWTPPTARINHKLPKPSVGPGPVLPPTVNERVITMHDDE